MAPKDWPQAAPVTSPTLNSEEASFYGDNDERDTVRELIGEVREWLNDLENDVRKKE